MWPTRTQVVAAKKRWLEGAVQKGGCWIVEGWPGVADLLEEAREGGEARLGHGVKVPRCASLVTERR